MASAGKVSRLMGAKLTGAELNAARQHGWELGNSLVLGYHFAAKEAAPHGHQETQEKSSSIQQDQTEGT